MESLWNLVLLAFLIMAFIPAYQQRKLDSLRQRVMQRIQNREGSQVIVLIHRQETLSFLGLMLQRHIDIEDSEQILRAIRKTSPEVPIDLILHTPGGLVLAAEQIALALAAHPARVRVLIPHYAMSGGTLLALAADEIVMDPNAVLGPIDPQLNGYPAASILNAIRQKGVTAVDDETLICGDIAQKAVVQVQHNVYRLLERKHEPRDAERIAKSLTEGRWTHDYPLHIDELEALGIPVTPGLSQDIYDLMDLYPQPTPRRPSVGYIVPPSPGDGRKGSGNNLSLR
ncbi:MAG: ATP-dependent Clp protease proteolytic subunit [Bacillota bacterium]